MFNSVETVNRIFVMLGNRCNCNCNYCLQKKENILPSEINEDIFLFIEEELKKPRKDKLLLTFYGGEPLLYIDTIREFLRKLRNKPKYTIITNGKSLTQPIVDLLNRYNFNVTVSWDGKNSEKSRNYDVVQDKKDLLMKINNLGFSTVVNHFSYPKDILNDISEVNDEYRKKHKDNINFNIDSLYNFNNEIGSVFDIDKNKLYNQMKEIIIGFKNTNAPIEDFYIERLHRICKPKKDVTFYSMCSNGIRVLNMDLKGNLYLCHNNYEKILGTIYSNTDEYMKKYSEYFNIQQRFEERCNNCNIKMYCKGGCMLLEEKNFNEYCSQRKAMFKEFFQLYGKLTDIKEILTYEQDLYN